MRVKKKRQAGVSDDERSSAELSDVEMKSAEEDLGSEQNAEIDDEVEEQLGRGARSRAKVINFPLYGHLTDTWL